MDGNSSKMLHRGNACPKIVPENATLKDTRYPRVEMAVPLLPIEDRELDFDGANCQVKTTMGFLSSQSGNLFFPGP